MTQQTLRFGILGAARIAPPALIEPCKHEARASVQVIAARDPERAAAFAQRHGIPQVSRTYQELIERDDVDAVYNALPASLHAPWTIAALRAGKHVLCEKPFALDAAQAREMVAAAGEAERVLVEAFHYRYHPLALRVHEIAHSGVLGRLERVAGHFRVPIPDQSDIRYELRLGGGATMDLGCYPLHWLRMFTGREPRVLRAQAKQDPPGIDVQMDVELDFDGVPGRMSCAMHASAGIGAELHAVGSQGELRVTNPLAPQLGHRLELRLGGGEPQNETVPGRRTYDHQLEAFVATVLDGAPAPTGGEDAIANMRAIDAVYAAAGLPGRAEAA